MVANHLEHEQVKQFYRVLTKCVKRFVPADIDDLEVVQEHESVDQDSWDFSHHVSNYDEHKPDRYKTKNIVNSCSFSLCLNA